MSTPLLINVAGLLSASLATAAVGAWFGRKIESGIIILVLALAYIGGTFAVFAASYTNPPLAITVLLAWTFVSGLVMGPGLQTYVRQLGWQTVAGTFLGTAGVMAICGCIGALSGIDFGGVQKFLIFGLIGLIAMSIIGIFVRMSRTVNIIWSLIGMGVFSVFFMVDFWQMKDSSNTLNAAIQITMKLYLDFINFFWYALQFIQAFMDKH